MWVAPDGLASAPHPSANRGGTVGGAAAASSEPPGLQRPEASHPPAGRPEPRAAPPALPDRCSWGRTAGPSRWLTSSGTPAADGCWPGKAASSRSSTGWCWNNSLRGFPRRPGLAKPYRPSLSLPSPSFSPPTFLPRSCAGVVPRVQPRWRGGPAPESAAVRAHAREAGSASPSAATSPVPPVSPCQFLVPLPATRVAGKPGPACWRCGDPGHFIDRCPMMEVGTLVQVPDAPQAAPNQAGGYQIPVSIKGGTYWALVDSGCNQTSIHQSLV